MHDVDGEKCVDALFFALMNQFCNQIAYGFYRSIHKCMSSPYTRREREKHGQTHISRANDMLRDYAGAAVAGVYF